jgi:peptidyl-tRNA hydrolase, PTH1 family
LIVGLGNPGERYARTRHNVGFEVASLLAERWQLPKAQKRYGGLLTEGRIGPGMPRVAVLLPQTFMNESGRAVGPARGEYRLDLDQVVAVHDEIDLPFGALRVKFGGSTAGHNGLRSLAGALRTPEFYRVRLGVGRPTGRKDAADWVLEDFAKREEADVAQLVDDGADATLSIVRDGLQVTQDRYNRSGPRS